MPLFKPGTVHVPHRKNTAGMPAVRMAPPATVLIPLSMHIGAPAVPVVKIGDEVKVGTLIAEAGGFVSAPIHSSVSGKVKKIDSYLASSGRSCPAILIESDGLMTPDESIAPPVLETLDDFIAAVRKSGLVGLGGAGFPTSVKFEAERKGQIDTVLINAAECEPYITSDTRTMLDRKEDIAEGVRLLEKFLRADRILFGIEENKPDCIEAMCSLFETDGRVEVMPLPSTYPQGGEKILILNTTGRVVPEGKLPADVGVIVLNVTSLAFLGSYAKTGMPLVEKCLTVDGSAIKNPMNVIAPIGASIRSVIEFTGGFSEEPGKILYGGPMMGITVWSDEDPILKNNNAILALNQKDAKPKPSYLCIHCGRCVAACPMGLEPTAFEHILKIKEPDDRGAGLEHAKVNLCIECGCCSFVCPSRRPLVESNRLAKADLREYQARKKAAEAE